MKRIAWAATALIVVALIIVFANSPKPRNVSATWVGFTNNAVGQHEALFTVRNWDRSVTWNVYGLQRKGSGDWKNSYPTPTAWSSYRRGNDYVLGVAVPATNESWRVVLFCQERRPGWRGLLDRGKEVYERYTTRSIRSRYDGRRYHVTNDLPKTINKTTNRNQQQTEL